MPYRNAHWYLLTSFPLVGLAFWPTYFSVFSTSAFPLHAHAAVGTVWIAILTIQSWTIHHGNRDTHRQTGIVSLMVFPLFVAASAAVVVLMAQEFANKLSPVSVIYGPRLGLGSLILVTGFAYCYWQALRQRRKVHPHSRYMLSTIMFLLPPIVVRLFRLVPALDIHDPQEIWKLGFNIQLANIIVALFAFILAWRSGKHGRPFFEAGAVTTMNVVLIPTIGVMRSWDRLFAYLASVPLPIAAFAAGVVGIVIAYFGWIAGKRPTRDLGMIPA
jgi:hypothetical protein